MRVRGTPRYVNGVLGFMTGIDDPCMCIWFSSDLVGSSIVFDFELYNSALVRHLFVLTSMWAHSE